MSIPVKSGESRPAVRRSKAILVIILLFLFMVMLLVAGFVHQSIKLRIEHEEWIAHMESVVYVDTFYEGIYLDNIVLSGKTLAEAKALFSQRADEKLAEMTLNIHYDDAIHQFDYRDINAKIDWEVKLEEAYQIARTGVMEDRYQRIMALKDKELKFETLLSYHVDLIKEDILAIAENIFLAPVDADIAFSPSASDKFKISNEETGLYVDGEALYAEASQQIHNGTFETIVIEPEILVPSVLAANLQKATHMVTKFSTDLLQSTDNRIFNVELALSKVNGYRINPGEVFSFNDSVGPRTTSTGFKMAPVIMPDKSLQDGIGGGICQASSMLYNAALMAGMEIVERYHHSFPVAYVPYGLDATVSYGGADIRFKNTNDTPMFLRTYSVGKLVYVEIYGEPLPNAGKIVLESVLTERVPAPATQRIEDTTGKHVTTPGGQKEHVKSRDGLRVTSYLHYYEQGKLIKTEVVRKDYYRPIQGITYYKKDDKPAPAPAPAPTPAPAPAPAPTPAPVEDEEAQDSSIEL